MTSTSPVDELSFRTSELNLTAAQTHHIAKKAIVPVQLPQTQFWPANPKTAAILSKAEISLLKQQIVKLGSFKSERQSYVPITKLLNILSTAQARANADTERWEDIEHFPTVVCLPNPNQPLPGDTHDTKLQPDLVMTIRPYCWVKDYLEKLGDGEAPRLDDLRPCFSALVAAGETKTRKDGSSQLLNYLDAVKRYRPDVDRVYGLFGRTKGFSIYQLNPCQATKLALESEGTDGLLPWGNTTALSVLQRFIIALYVKPVLSDTLTLRPTTTQVWVLKYGKEQWSMVPCYAGHGPGRMTWVAAALKDGEKDTKRIAKIYWVDKRGSFREVDLYKRAHGQAQNTVVQATGPATDEETKLTPKTSWLGGLARVEDYQMARQDIEGQSPPSTTKCPISRQLVGLLIGSSGKPLNNLKTDIDILKCMYDLLETLRQMNRNGVLHRDISFGNIFCYPEHYIHPEEKGQTAGCIDDVLKEKDPKFRVLVSDLDQGSEISAANPSAGDPLFGSPDANMDPVGRERRTGTPMFAADAIADPNWEYPLGCHDIIKNLSKKSDKTFSHPQLKKIAKPDLNLYKKLLKDGSVGAENYAITREAEDEDEALEPPLHQPHHDAESVYWLMAFLLARAMPLHARTDVTPRHDWQNSYNLFCTAMLSHHIGQCYAPRSTWGTSIMPKTWARTLHPMLKHHASLLYKMAYFLSVDWITICPGTDGDFAYRVLKLFLLEQIINTREVVELNNESPRPAISTLDRANPSARVNTTSPDIRTSLSATTSSSSNGIQLTEEPSEDETANDDLQSAPIATKEMFHMEGQGARLIQTERIIAERWYMFAYKK